MCQPHKAYLRWGNSVAMKHRGLYTGESHPPGDTDKGNRSPKEESVSSSRNGSNTSILPLKYRIHPIVAPLSLVYEVQLMCSLRPATSPLKPQEKKDKNLGESKKGSRMRG